MFFPCTCVATDAPNSGCIQPNRLARAFDFVVGYTKGEEKVCVLDGNPWLAKMVITMLSVKVNEFTRVPEWWATLTSNRSILLRNSKYNKTCVPACLSFIYTDCVVALLYVYSNALSIKQNNMY